MTPLSSWGRLSACPHRHIVINEPEKIAEQLKSSAPGIAFGNGRSYGDVCLNPNGSLWHTRMLDRMISFDRVTGKLACDAGVLLGDIQRMVVPLGWMLPVTPGTQMVTIGGAIANDVHGKNHARMGSFGDHVLNIKLLRTDGGEVECSKEKNPLWFSATVGGLGLTGVMRQVEIQLRPVAGPWLETETLPFWGLSEFFELSEQSTSSWEHTVSWIDCLSGPNLRGLFKRARSVDIEKSLKTRRGQRNVSFVPPFSMVNRLTLKTFNAAYFHLNKNKAGVHLAHYQKFFYPLDNLLNWNRIYGPRGFYQYQSLVPARFAQVVTGEMLKTIAATGEGSFLAVLKVFGNRQSAGMLGFPGPGVTLALDFPNRGAPTLSLLTRLDAIVREAGGRIYAAKDARMPVDLWRSGYPRLGEFMPYRDPGISSGLSRRLMGS